MTTSLLDPTFAGAEKVTSMTAGITAQLHTGLYNLANSAKVPTSTPASLASAKVPTSTPVSLALDNETAAKFAMATAALSSHAALVTATGIVWQVVSAHRPKPWGHTYSHMGEPMNEVADSVVEYMAWTEEAWSVQPCLCSVCANLYQVAQMKLMYLFCFFGRRVCSTRILAPLRTRRQSPRHFPQMSSGVASIGCGRCQWCPEGQSWSRYRLGTGTVALVKYNPCTLRAERARATLHKKFNKVVLAYGIQVARPRESDTSILLENCGSAAMMHQARMVRLAIMDQSVETMGLAR